MFKEDVINNVNLGTSITRDQYGPNKQLCFKIENEI